ncbi:MAG TPA: GAF domain-containing sensor histidine kinase [Solirubrobacteraceae bacterium]|nr:GAF domain-containing sensor histidine kinase [Solirubrobacteraceae bacterium]
MSVGDQPRPVSGVLGVLDLARGVLADLDLDGVLERLIEATRDLTGARYAALGVLDRSRSELERFITVGIDEATHERIGALPRGRGVLGELINDPQPLRIAQVGAHPRSYGFPPGHPEMNTFLGVPILVAGEPFGNLYLTEKADGAEFTDEDEQAVARLADLAGVAIDHAQRYQDVAAQRYELKRTVDTLDATMQIARAVGGETNLGPVLELIAKRGRALVSARALVIERPLGKDLIVAAGAGKLPRGLVGQSVDPQESVASAALRTLRTLRLENEPNLARFDRHGLGRLGVRASAGLVVPLVFRGRGYGVLIAVDRLENGPSFSAEDQRLLEAFAASAATAVATADSVDADRRRQRLAATEQERTRWARELHDETLQNLASVRLGLAAQVKRPELETAVAAIHDAMAQLEVEIGKLRSLITDLRPAALDDVGTEQALIDLAERVRGRGLEVELKIDLAYEQGREAERHVSEVETTVYRVVQEALTNAIKHGGARRAAVQIDEDQTTVRIIVRDDGDGFDPDAKTDGFGLIGMRERAELVGGTFDVQSAPGSGTTILVELPAHHRRRAQIAGQAD